MALIRAVAALAALLLAALVAGRGEARELPVLVEGGDAGEATDGAPAARVTVRAEAGLERQARQAARQATRDLATIEGDLSGLPRIERVEVRLVKRSASLAEVAPPGRGAPAWAAGVAWPGTEVVAVAARGPGGELVDVERTLRHELSHLALDRALGQARGDGRVPRWLTEGFAYLHSSDFSWARAQTLMGAVVGGRVVPLGALDDAFPAREDEVALAYAQSYDFVAFLSRRGRWEDERDDGSLAAFRQFLDELAHGRGLDEAAERAFGRPLRQLEAEWLEELRTRYLWLPIGVGATLLWVVAAGLLLLGWLRKRRLGRRRLAQWELEEAPREASSPAPAETPPRLPS